jgi:hypothetical protein
VIYARLDDLANTLDQLRALTRDRPIWVDELNLIADYEAEDPAMRPWNGLGSSWRATAYIRAAMRGSITLFQFQYLESRQLGLIDLARAQPLLSYWDVRSIQEALLSGSPIVPVESGTDAIEALAIDLGATVRMLIAHRHPGPIDVKIALEGRAPSSGSTGRFLDDRLSGGGPIGDLERGPQPIDVDPRLGVHFAGYGAAIIDL